MNFVKVFKQQNSAPTETQLKQAIVDVGGIPGDCEGNNAARTVWFTGLVSHTRFENKLIEIVPGARRTSWSFAWADEDAFGESPAAELGATSLLNHVTAAALLTLATAVSTKAVTIQIAVDDLKALKQAGYRLCFAKKVGDAAYNVVWQSSAKYLASNKFSWVPQFQLFGCNSFQENVQVDVSTNLVTIGLGEKSTLSAEGVMGPASSSEQATAIVLNNQYGSIHPGVSQLSTGIDGTISATPIYVAENPVVKGQTELKPVEKVLVWFEQNIETSTMFSDSRSDAVEINLTDENTATRLYSDGAWSKPGVYAETAKLNAGRGNGARAVNAII